MGQVCQRHQGFYEDECRYCEPPPTTGEWAGYTMLPVSAILPQFKQIPSYAEMLSAEIGVETIGPGESKFWMDFINTKYCKADPAEQWPPGGVTGDGG